MKSRLLAATIAAGLICMCSQANAFEFLRSMMSGGYGGCGCDNVCGCDNKCGCNNTCGCDRGCWGHHRNRCGCGCDTGKGCGCAAPTCAAPTCAAVPSCGCDNKCGCDRGCHRNRCGCGHSRCHSRCHRSWGCDNACGWDGKCGCGYDAAQQRAVPADSHSTAASKLRITPGLRPITGGFAAFRHGV